MKFSPNEKHLEYMRFCLNNKLIKLALSRVSEDVDKYYIESIDFKDYSNTRFLCKNNKLPPTPDNKISLEYDQAHWEMFKIYEEHYYRVNLAEKILLDELTLQKEKEELSKKQIMSKKSRSSINNKESKDKSSKSLNTIQPNKQIDLLDMIAEVEQEMIDANKIKDINSNETLSKE